MESKRFNPEHADKLMSPDRKAKIQPEALIDQLQIQANDTVADLGAGPGLFTLPMAKLTNRTVYAIDVSQDMLDMLQKNAEAKGIANIQLIQSDMESIDLTANSIDHMVNAFVIHEVGDVNQTIDEMIRLLSPAGQLLMVDWEAVESESGPPLHIRISSGHMEQLLQDKGFRTDTVQTGPEHYAIKASRK